MLYVLLKWVHVLAAIVGLGSNITYGIWLNQPAHSSQFTVQILKTIRVLDGRLANPAYVISLITGISLVFVGNWSLTTPWILVALVLYFAVALLGMFKYGPTLRRQIRLAETVGTESPEYAATARESNILGVTTVVLVVIIVFLMVVKPSLWA